MNARISQFDPDGHPWLEMPHVNVCNLLALAKQHRRLKHNDNIKPFTRYRLECAVDVIGCADLRGHDVHSVGWPGNLQLLSLGRPFGH